MQSRRKSPRIPRTPKAELDPRIRHLFNLKYEPDARPANAVRLAQRAAMAAVQRDERGFKMNPVQTKLFLDTMNVPANSNALMNVHHEGNKRVVGVLINCFRKSGDRFDDMVRRTLLFIQTFQSRVRDLTKDDAQH